MDFIVFQEHTYVCVHVCCVLLLYPSSSSLPLFLLPFPSPFPLTPPLSPLLPSLPSLPSPPLPRQVMEELRMLKARNPFTPVLFVTLNLPTSDDHAMEMEDRLVQDLNSIGYLNEDASVLPPEVLYPAQSPQVSCTSLQCDVTVSAVSHYSIPMHLSHKRHW